VQARIAGGLDDIPPFPIEAALIGLAASLLVGALAGLLPAFVAVRIKVIDAIRF
jgi:putative ABC transport system permease protein